MASVSVRPVTSRREKKLFLEFPWRLYRDDPHWVPPIRIDEKELVGYAHHPFYDKNAVQTFLAYRDGEVVGRVAAVVNRTHIEYCKDRRGFFGFFECRDDAEAAQGLLASARQWLAEQDLPAVRGPANPSCNYVQGVLVEGFDSPPTFMMPYNPPYYDRLLAGCGLRKSQDLYAFWANTDMMPKSDAHGPLVEQIKERFGVKIRPLDPRRFRQDVRDFLEIYNRSMVGGWGFSPMSEAELNHMAKYLRYLVIPELVVGGEIDGRLAGIVLVLPDYNPRIRQIDGKLFPFGFLRLLWNKRKIKKVRVLAANVLPEYQLMGVALVLLREMVPKGLAYGISEVEYSWIAESNSLSRGSLEKGGAKRIKTYRMYDAEG